MAQLQFFDKGRRHHISKLLLSVPKSAEHETCAYADAVNICGNIWNAYYSKCWAQTQPDYICYFCIKVCFRSKLTPDSVSDWASEGKTDVALMYRYWTCNRSGNEWR